MCPDSPVGGSGALVRLHLVVDLLPQLPFVPSDTVNSIGDFISVYSQRTATDQIPRFRLIRSLPVLYTADTLPPSDGSKHNVGLVAQLGKADLLTGVRFPVSNRPVLRVIVFSFHPCTTSGHIRSTWETSS
jgi:hypothetical protein